MHDILDTFDDLPEQKRLELLDQAEVVPRKFAPALKLKAPVPSSASEAAAKVFAKKETSDGEDIEDHFSSPIPTKQPVVVPAVKRRALEMEVPVESVPVESVPEPAPAQIVEKLFKLRKVKKEVDAERVKAQSNYLNFMAQEAARLPSASPEYAAKSIEENALVMATYQNAIKAVAETDAQIAFQEKAVKSSLVALEEECAKADAKVKELAKDLQRASDDADGHRKYLELLKEEFSRADQMPPPSVAPSAAPPVAPAVEAAVVPAAAPPSPLQAPTQAPTQALPFSPAHSLSSSPPRVQNLFSSVISPGMRME